MATTVWQAIDLSDPYAPGSQTDVLKMFLAQATMGPAVANAAWDILKQSTAPQEASAGIERRKRPGSGPDLIVKR